MDIWPSDKEACGRCTCVLHWLSGSSTRPQSWLQLLLLMVQVMMPQVLVFLSPYGRPTLSSLLLTLPPSSPSYFSSKRKSFFLASYSLRTTDLGTATTCSPAMFVWLCDLSAAQHPQPSQPRCTCRWKTVWASMQLPTLFPRGQNQAFALIFHCC